MGPRLTGSQPSPPGTASRRLFAAAVAALRPLPGRITASLRDGNDPRIIPEQERVILARVQVAGWIAFILIPFTILLYLAGFRSDAIERGLLASLAANTAVAALILGIRRGLFDRHPHLAMLLLMGVICNFAAGAMISLAVSQADAFFTYYVIFFGTATMFPARLAWVAATCACIIAGYPLAEWTNGQLARSASLVSNLLRLVDFGFVTLVANRVITALFLRERRSQLDLADANARLHEIDRLKSDLFANLSHELRTPLTLILAPLGSLLDSPTPLADRERYLLETARKHAERLLGLINDLLLLARLDAGKVERTDEPVDVVRLCRDVVESMRPLATQLALELRFQGPGGRLCWIGDRRHLERVVLNLLSNACKFSRPGGRVTVRVTGKGSSVALDVRDEGVGIRAADLPRIFDRFVQAETSASRRFEGTGIGLAIVKELTELYGGHVGVRSTPGVGTSFRVRLPLGAAVPTGAMAGQAEPQRAPSAEAAAAARLEATPRGRAVTVSPTGDRPRLLIVEDNVDLLDYLAAELARDFDVTPLADSREALRNAGEAPPDLVISDVMMPHLDGIELCRRLRESSATREIPLILISARGDVATKLSGFAEGADDYVHKPFEMSELRARIHLQLTLRAQAGALSRRNAELTRLSEHLAAALRQVRDAELRIVQNEKLATLGTVVAGVAHEINNPLHFALGNVALLKDLVTQAHGDGKPRLDAAQLFRDVHASLDRIALITRDLYQFARREPGAVDDVDLEALFELVRKLLAHQMRGQVQITAHFGAAPHVRGASQELFQVLINLVQNALQAVGEGGHIDVSAHAVTGGVDLVVRDDGPGIPRDQVGRIFEPFFTTRPAGEGLGLGLSLVERIAMSHGGSVRVESDPGRGTAFTVHLPQPGTSPGEPSRAA